MKVLANEICANQAENSVLLPSAVPKCALHLRGPVLRIEQSSFISKFTIKLG